MFNNNVIGIFNEFNYLIMVLNFDGKFSKTQKHESNRMKEKLRFRYALVKKNNLSM